MNVGDQVTVMANGTFHGCTGKVARVTQHARRSRIVYWIVFDNHDWQRALPGADWSFHERELELVAKPGGGNERT